MKSTKTIILLVVSMLVGLSLTAQSGYYSNTAEYIGSENPFPQSCIQKAYIVENTQVIEYFDNTRNRFLGFYSDGDFVNISKMDIVKNNPHLKSMLRKVTMREALTFVYDKITPGMKLDEVLDILGKPDKFKYAISGNHQLLYYYYNTGDFEKLVFKDNILISAI